MHFMGLVLTSTKVLACVFFKRFFDVDHFKNLYWICYNIASFYVLLFCPQGMWDLSSLMRVRTCTPCIGRQSLNHWTTREVPPHSLLVRRRCFLVKLACHLLHSTCFKNFSDIPIIINNSLPLPASLVAQLVKNLPAVQETPVQFLDREDPLEKG